MNYYFWLGRMLFSSALRSFFSFRVINPRKRIEHGGAIIAANHASFLDPPVVGCAYEHGVHFLARETLFRGFASWLLPRWNAIPIDRDQADLKSMKTVLRALKGGKRVVMFPEGTRTMTGDLQDAKAGLGLLIAKSGVPVQPVRVLGTYEALPKGRRSLRLHPITVIIGDPIQFEPEQLRGKSREAYQALADRVMAEIAALAPEGVPLRPARG
ncbi:MAG: 1-acyl-sn-glycerol-3-phosphate acyltransferase [Akkermansiaceae bacterium]|nr:1-acyl-sn-glycerol-3-phosphate acyltransferase [Akkermansiaceae bacterium]